MDQELDRRYRNAPRSMGVVTRALLACGVLYALSYVVVNDVVGATRYQGYSRISQAISELSATGAPTRSLLTAMTPIVVVLLAAFGLGVWRSAGGNRGLRVTGGLLVAHAATFPLWALAPMTSRGQMVGTLPANDIVHMALTVLTLTFILFEMGFGGAAFGRRFRIYSLLSAAAVVVFGLLTGLQSANLPAGRPTPWLGLVERASAGAWLLWLAMLAVVSWAAARGGDPQGATPAPPPRARGLELHV